MSAKLFNCFLCGYSINRFCYVCDACYEILPWNSCACCMCSQALPYGHGLCAKCRLHRPKFKILAPFLYNEIMAHIIKMIKYYGVVEVHAFLAETLINYILVNGYMSKADVIIPVPLFVGRQRKRGFNQAIELAKAINNLLQIDVDYFGCVRVKNTPSQTRYDSLERRRNLRQAFVANTDFSGKRVVVLDDVVTTGATVGELSEVIYGKGALSVEVWAIARA